VAQSQTKKSNLQDPVAQSQTKKSNLQDPVAQSQTKKSNLQDPSDSTGPNVRLKRSQRPK
jgi:hypothetical protein